MAKTIFITGASRGFGKLWAQAFLERGDKVIATARNLDSLKDLARQYPDTLLPLQLDVTDRAAVFATVSKAADHFGQIDVLINNAGYGLFGAVEEASEKEARAQLEVNVFGLLWATQAVLPLMRRQGSGHIIQVSSILGITTVPTMGLYNATKFAIEGLSETLATEVGHFGIHVTLVEPNAYSTDFIGGSAARSTPIPSYEPIHKAASESFAQEDIWGDPKATPTAILKLVDAPHPPLRLFLGKKALPWAQEAYKNRLATWEEWNDVAVAAHG
ncbi:SDR family oxidoreductase [Dinghuibacter silviterrae]|uniref:NADP-dependent 3-hydroxy acid dehydrogenase YdfG n=1 Tax=Dinghuibacter silviterrae TaxID=1539049 RepID=A0A4R8DN48_9BACT|nr:SDR family oxidoreductase [Dinghuibacter silviterrae]TDW99125.1 NADP-dependent 3-hydroxy acid dehydrogenase YdfG [Dinghuibacter silviterrae]